MTAKELNLCESLKGCEGMVFYSTMVRYCRLIEITEYITIGYGDDDYVFLESDGKYSIDGECMLFPSKENRGWSTFKRGPFMCYDGKDWVLKNTTCSGYVVPVSEFNFDDFESNKVGKYNHS